MDGCRSADWTRREFLGGLALTGTAALMGLAQEPAAAEPPPETTRIRFPLLPFDVACVAPQWVAESFLRAEGFATPEYVKVKSSWQGLARGDVDFIITDALTGVLRVDEGDPITILTGVHGGCYELIGTGQVRSIRDLGGKTVGFTNPGRRAFIATMASYVGLDPRRDIRFVEPATWAKTTELLAQGRIDAYLAFPPEPQELRARRIGHVVVSTVVDRPWSQYFCCMLIGHREFVRRHPAATKRVLRAILKATDLCAAAPQKIARFLADKGYVKREDYALQALQEVPYNRWREYDSPDTIRFYSLRMHEAGVIKSSPQRILAQGTDWRFLNELKKELKG
jgi:NitT/TauT family transport system substrate-binding protein